MEVPRSLSLAVAEFLLPGEAAPLPLFLSQAAAGFPNPGDDYIDRVLDLNELLIQHPTGTFFVRVQGDSMEGLGIHSGDLLVVDRTLRPASGKVVIAALNGELVVKQFKRTRTGAYLVSHHDGYPPLRLDADADLVIWGVVTFVIHAV